MQIGVGRLLWIVLAGMGSLLHSRAADLPPPPSLRLSVADQKLQLAFPLSAATESYNVLRASQLGDGFDVDPSGSFWGGLWTAPLDGESGFYRLQVTPLDANILLATTVLNRLAYGPTPDDLERVLAMGPEAYIAEQLAPERIAETLSIDAPPPESKWEFVTSIGRGSSSDLYVYLESAGEGFIDDLMLVAGTNAGAGPNLLRNGGFEAPLATNDWTVSPNHAASALTTEAARSGNSSLKLVASSAGSTRGSSVWQRITPSLSNSRQYTLSYWFLRSTNRPSRVAVRLSGSGLVSGSTPDSLWTQLMTRQAGIDTLRAWHVRRAVESKRQLLEVLLQFLENHFVTQYTKSREYFDRFYNGTEAGWLATEMELRELQRWRQALLNPQCTFHDLLKISAESPAMIIYLDTVSSRGDGRQIANENYARELLELFTFGVDNGYDQTDIVEISKAWTGWRVELVDRAQESNPLAPRLVDLNPGVNVTNLSGVWTFKYRPDRHHNNTKTIFRGKTVPSRFGPPYAGAAYQLDLPARSGANGLQDGYEILAHLANQPFTQEYLSVKLCRLFVHDEFATGYDFTDPNLSAEGQLVRACMQAWRSSSPPGQIRPVLAAIFASDLFRGHGASLHKVKTPLEFTVSALRALRSLTPDGTFTVESDGNLGAILNRMGGMRLFDRDDPDGYPEAAAPWISAGTLAERLRFVQALQIARNQSGRADAGNSFTDPVALLKNKLPAGEWTRAAAVADYFLSILYPAEGQGNLALYRQSAIDFLETADDGVSASPFRNLAATSATYDTRIRGLVAMLLTFQRFQEQ